MNWLRDNILKILVILGVVIVAIVIVTLFSKPSTKDNTVAATRYGELETKIQNAAINYTKKNTNLLPSTAEEAVKIQLKTLQEKNYIGKLVAVEDSSVKCDGYVEINKISNTSYRYTPFVSCGKYYVTRTIGDYIVEKETNDGTFERTTDSGLYKSGNEYIFKGEKANNYIMLDKHLYRIIKVADDNSLQLISTYKTSETYPWDDRYNINRKNSEGINDFNKSRLKDTLDSLYNQVSTKTEEAFFSPKEKNYIVAHEFCTAKRSITDKNMYSGVECNEKTKLRVGLITMSDYSKASIDENCKGIFDRTCANYNYFNSLTKNSNYTYVTLTAVADNTYQYYKIAGGVAKVSKASSYVSLYPVIFINPKTIYSSGSGTISDPYIVR